MKNIVLKLAVVATALLALVGCSQTTTYYLNVSPSSEQNVSATTTSVPFTVSANVAWAVSLNGTQVHAGVSGDNQTYSVTIPQNASTTTEEIYTVVFSSTDVNYSAQTTVIIRQRAAIDPSQPYLEVTPSSNQSVAHNITSFTFAVEANVAWSCEVDGVQAKTGTGDDAAVVVTFPANTNTGGTAVRVVTFESTDPLLTKTITVNITQGAAPVVIVNMLDNPSFETLSSGVPASWTNAGTAWSVLTTGAKDGTNSVRMEADSSNRCDVKQTITGITPGKTYVISFWYKDNSPATGSSGLRIWSNFIDGTGTAIYPATGESVDFRPTTYLAETTSWTEFTCEAVAPANAASFNFEIRATKNQYATIDMCSFTEK